VAQVLAELAQALAERAQVMAALVPATSAQAMARPESPAPAIREPRVFPQQSALARASLPPDQMAMTAQRAWPADCRKPMPPGRH